jgi:hypothetical protein
MRVQENNGAIFQANATLSLPRDGMRRGHLAARGFFSRPLPTYQSADCGHGDACQRDSRYGPGAPRQPHHGEQGTHKKAPALQQVPQTVLASGHPAYVEGEICRAEEREERRGLPSELDDMWSCVGKQAN